MADGKPVKTETVIRQYDADGNLVAETATTVVVTKPADDAPAPGQYL